MSIKVLVLLAALRFFLHRSAFLQKSVPLGVVDGHKQRPAFYIAPLFPSVRCKLAADRCKVRGIHRPDGKSGALQKKAHRCVEKAHRWIQRTAVPIAAMGVVDGQLYVGGCQLTLRNAVPTVKSFS